tara:strand:+ start:178 stop:438 length:261 start_codon:yes stop_codon:yes gene_type:complete
MIEARALLAIGMDGSFVVLEVNADNNFLAHDANLPPSQLMRVLKFATNSAPRGPGIYEFTGYSALEPYDATSIRVVHRGECVRVAG